MPEGRLGRSRKKLNRLLLVSTRKHPTEKKKKKKERDRRLREEVDERCPPSRGERGATWQNETPKGRLFDDEGSRQGLPTPEQADVRDQLENEKGLDDGVVRSGDMRDGPAGKTTCRYAFLSPLVG